MRMQLRQEMQNYELQTASKTLLCSCFQPPAKGDEALPDEWKFLFTSHQIRQHDARCRPYGLLKCKPPIPLFSRAAVRALSIILSELCLSVQSVAATWPSLHNALREEEAATGCCVCQTCISQHQVPWGLLAPGVNAGQLFFYYFVTQQTACWCKIFHSSLFVLFCFFWHFWHPWIAQLLQKFFCQLFQCLWGCWNRRAHTHYIYIF